jgi:hypothetical protein
MKEKTTFFLRKFLNRKGYHSNAFIFAEINRSEGKDKKGKVQYWHDTELKIADCDRIVSLSMDLHSVNLASNSLHKLDILIASLKSFRNAFAKEAKLIQKRKK